MKLLILSRDRMDGDKQIPSISQVCVAHLHTHGLSMCTRYTPPQSDKHIHMKLHKREENSAAMQGGGGGGSKVVSFRCLTSHDGQTRALFCRLSNTTNSDPRAKG